MGEGRGTSNAPNTRNPERPVSKPSRLDQFADDVVDYQFGDIKLPETLEYDKESVKEKGKR